MDEKEFSEALRLKKEFNNLRNSLMKDPNVEFFLFVHDLANIPIELFQPFASFTNAEMKQKHKNIQNIKQLR